MNSKHCPYCHYIEVVKVGKVRGRQRYRCENCGRTWLTNAQPQRLERYVWNDYAKGGMSLDKLATKYHFSQRKIQDILKDHLPPIICPSGPADVIVMDATYFGHKWGIILALNAISGEPLYCHKIGAYETNMDYWLAMRTLEKIHIHPKVCVIDGKLGVRRMLEEDFRVLVQVCQFHQMQTVIQNVTRRPDLEPNQELLSLAYDLPHMNEERFVVALASWQLKYGHWVEERTYLSDHSGKFSYTHAKTRRAFYSIKRNRPYLFTYERYPELQIPKTSNMIEGRFGVIKTKLVPHRGCNDEMKWKLFLDLLINGTK